MRIRGSDAVLRGVLSCNQSLKTRRPAMRSSRTRNFDEWQPVLIDCLFFETNRVEAEGELSGSGAVTPPRFQVQGLIMGAGQGCMHSTARNAPFGLHPNLVHFRTLPNLSKLSGFRPLFRDKLDLTTAVANHLRSFTGPTFLERVPSGSFEDFPFHLKQRNSKLSPRLTHRLFLVIESLNSPVALHSELCLYCRSLCFLNHYIHRHRDQFTYHGTQHILNLHETKSRQSLTPNP